jgi:hypothetical protein
MLSGDFAWKRLKSSVRVTRFSQQTEFFSQPDGLHPPFRPEFFKCPATVSLYRVFAYMELPGDFPIAQALRDQPQNLKLSGCNP